jgi:hypothetical protein
MITYLGVNAVYAPRQNRKRLALGAGAPQGRGLRRLERAGGAHRRVPRQSYRDPNLEATLAIFDEAGAFLRSTDLGEDGLTRAIIAAVRDSDPYEGPEARGFAALRRALAGETDEQRRALREALLRWYARTASLSARRSASRRAAAGGPGDHRRGA